MGEELNNLPDDLPELTADDRAALESIPDDAVSHWYQGEKWDFERKIWIPFDHYLPIIERLQNLKEEYIADQNFEAAAGIVKAMVIVRDGMQNLGLAHPGTA